MAMLRNDDAVAVDDLDRDALQSLVADGLAEISAGRAHLPLHA
jgi:hypothetical protein